MHDPAFGLTALQSELGDQFDWRSIHEDVDLVGAKLAGHACAVIERSIALGGEAGADVPEEVRQHGVVGGIEYFESEAGFDGDELGQHGRIYDL